MCVVSAVMDYGKQQWPDLLPPAIPEPFPGATPWPIAPAKPIDFDNLIKKPDLPGSRLPTKAEIEAFLKLVKAAEEFDKRAAQPHCEDPEKIKLLRAIEERLKRIEDRMDAERVAGSTLFGSNSFGALIAIGDRQVQLGEVVRRAFNDWRPVDGERTAEAWNDLNETYRDRMILDAIHDMRTEATS